MADTILVNADLSFESRVLKVSTEGLRRIIACTSARARMRTKTFRFLFCHFPIQLALLFILGSSFACVPVSTAAAAVISSSKAAAAFVVVLTDIVFFCDSLNVQCPRN
jgi:hypothetical protein